jgi:thiol-disulfide isomerase/thioredoxin
VSVKRRPVFPKSRAVLAARLTVLAAVAGLAAGSAPAVAAAPLDLAAMRGHVVYLDFWASWCGPCKQSFPWMQSLHSTYAGRGLDVVAVDVDSDRSDADRFLGRFHPDFRVLFDPSGSLADRYGVKGMPTSMLIDRHGKVRFVHVGFVPVEAEKYEQQVESLLAEK